MKYLITYLLLSLLFTSCYRCHDCIGPGQNASSWFIYKNNSIVTYKSSANENAIFQISMGENIPQEEYCGRVGSTSYNVCYGNGVCSYFFFNQIKTDSLLFMIAYTYVGDDGVERPSDISFQMDKIDFYCDNKGENAKSWDDHIETLNSYSQNGKNYEHVFHCTVGAIDSTVTITEFYYKKEAGLLKYIEKDGDIWTLQEP